MGIRDLGFVVLGIRDLLHSGFVVLGIRDLLHLGFVTLVISNETNYPITQLPNDPMTPMTPMN